MLRETVVLAYDSLLTLLEAEVPYIWQRKWKLGTVLYLLARYPMLLSFLISIIFSLNYTSLQVCFIRLLLTDIYDIVIIVSEAYLLQHSNLRHIGRATSWITSVMLFPCYLSLAFKVSHLFIPTMKIDCVSAGLLLARAYAVTDHKRLVVTVLGILGICSLVLVLVCTCLFL